MYVHADSACVCRAYGCARWACSCRAVRARRVLVKPMVVRAWRVLAACYGYAALGVCFSCDGLIHPEHVLAGTRDVQPLIEFPPGIRI